MKTVKFSPLLTTWIKHRYIESIVLIHRFFSSFHFDIFAIRTVRTVKRSHENRMHISLVSLISLSQCDLSDLSKWIQTIQKKKTKNHSYDLWERIALNQHTDMQRLLRRLRHWFSYIVRLTLDRFATFLTNNFTIAIVSANHANYSFLKKFHMFSFNFSLLCVFVVPVQNVVLFYSKKWARQFETL